MKLFPDHWAHPEASFEIVPTPVGRICAGCNWKIVDGERGLLLPHVGMTGVAELPWHRDCFKRAIGI